MHESLLNIVVAGAGGMAGGELLRILLGHPACGRLTALSRSRADLPVHRVHPALRHAPPLTFSGGSVVDAATDADVIFLALPHGESMAFMPDLLAAAPGLVLDLAGDFRLDDRAAFESVYGPHACFELSSRFHYGLCEAGELPENVSAIANPGCFATAAELLLLPLAELGKLPESVGVFAVTGSSGSGIRPKTGTHHPFRDGNFYAYKLLAHQHEPEIARALSPPGGKRAVVRLLAHSGPFVRGIHATALLPDPGIENESVADLYARRYAPHPFVTVLDEPPKLAEVAGTNHVHVHVSEKDGQAALTLALDNLVKGAAGQAVQNMNLALGLPETAGLEFGGIYPC